MIDLRVVHRESTTPPWAAVILLTYALGKERDECLNSETHALDETMYVPPPAAAKLGTAANGPNVTALNLIVRMQLQSPNRIRSQESLPECGVD